MYIIIYIITAVFAHSHLMPCATRELFEKNTHGEFDHYTHTVYVMITFDVYELYMYMCVTQLDTALWTGIMHMCSYIHC